MAILLSCATGIWADETEGQDVYLVALKAASSPESTGEGKVQLTLMDIKGKPMSENSVFAQLQLNKSNPSGFSPCVVMLGGTLYAVRDREYEIAMNESMQLYMTSYAYYLAEVQPVDGSYFAGWTINDPSFVEQKEITEGKVTFKVFPDDGDNKVTLPTDMSQWGNSKGKIIAAEENAKNNTRYVYALFRKYMLSNASATGGQVEGISGEKATIYVSVDIEGDVMKPISWSDLDFDNLSIEDATVGRWQPDLGDDFGNVEVQFYDEAQKATIIFPVVFTVQEGMNFDVYKSTLTISTKGAKPSMLSIPIAVTVLDPDPDRPAAILLDGKKEVETGELSYLINQVQTNTYDDPIIRLNKPYENLLKYSGKSFTLDLNGNTMGDITLTGGEMTIAYSKFGGSASNITVSGGKLILNGGTFTSLTVEKDAEVEQNGATVTGPVANHGTLTTTQGSFSGGLTSDGTLTLNGGSFAGATAITISGGTATLNRGTIVGTNYGVLASGGETTINKLAAISGGSNSLNAKGGRVTVNCGKFGAPISGTDISFTSGYFKTTDYGVSIADITEMQLTTGVEYNEGYRYFVGKAGAAKDNKVGVCRIGETSYATLEDALAYANNNPEKEVIIFMTNDYVLPAGYYTVPEKATIVVPMSDTQAKMINESAPKMVYNDVSGDKTHYNNNRPQEFRRLTFAKGVNIDVFGAIELTCHQYSSNEAYTGQPVGPYGRLEMEEGSHMTLQDGSQLRAWGYMTGKGETDARRGATVHEFFQMGDWKGALVTAGIVGLFGDATIKNYKIFPVSQYFIQNIESPIKYHPGAVLTTAAAVSEGVRYNGMDLSIAMATNDIKIIGVTERDDAIFLMDNEADAENTWVQKSYLVEQDIQNYDVNSSAHIGSMVIDLGPLTIPGLLPTTQIILNSAEFDLPITSNMKIHLRSGFMDFMQNTSLIPGSEVEVDKQSTVTISVDSKDIDHTGALYVYDADDWEEYAYNQLYTKVVQYSPSWADKTPGTPRPNIREEGSKPASAKINVHGTFDAQGGFVYTSASGANIFSSNEDAGTFKFNNRGESLFKTTPTVWNIIGSASYDSKEFSPAKLRNGDDSYTDTKDAAQETSYCYTNNRWSKWMVAEEDECFMTDGTDYYAKPQEYVKVVVAKGTDGKPLVDDNTGHFQGNADHTYSDAAGAGRLFILMGDCSWWEVEVKDNRYHCVHPDNDTYYQWVETYDENSKKMQGEWQEVRYNIRWQNWDGEVIKTSGGNAGPAVESYSVPYGTMAEFLGTNPTRDADIDYTYDFVGWSPALGRVTVDVTYTAQYERKLRKYTIVFCNEGGTEIERHFLTHNEVPVCENTPTKVGHYLQWNPAIAAVTGDATYTAKWLEEKPTEYQVTFVDYDGTTILKNDKVTAGTMPTEPANHPTGKAEAYKDNKEFTYSFVGWKPELAPATADITYTAVYEEVQRKYDVKFLNENGTEIETKQWSYGAIPVCSNPPTKADEQYSYSLVWTPQIEAVRGEQTYTAKFVGTPKKYTVTLRSNNDAVCTFTGAGIYDYGTKVKIAVTPAEGYEFVRWEERGGGAALDEMTVTGDITLTAVVKTTAVDISDLKLGTSDEVDVATLTNKEVMDLIITSNGTQSGQLKNAAQLRVDGSAHFDLSLGFAAHTWYAFGLPWRVSTNGGLRADEQTLQVDKNCFILEYDGARRASGNVNEETASSWNYVHAGATLQPGHLYMIYLTSDAKKVRFTKVANVTKNPIVNTTIEMAAYSSSATADAGWNGIANPTTYYATLSADGITEGKGQKYIPGQPYKDGKNTDRYEIFDLTTGRLAVGQPIFVQVSAAKTLVADESAGKFNAPRRESATDTPVEYELRLASAGSNPTDRLYVAATDEKDDAYVIGQDVAKISVAQGVAQWWVERYDTKLAANTTEFLDNEALFPLGIYAPAAGNYQLTVATPVDADHELMLTYDGLPVQDLSNGTACTITLQAGRTNRYGLLLVRKSPSISTDNGAAEAEQTNIRKVFVGGHVYIIRDGNVYSIFGQKIQ